MTLDTQTKKIIEGLNINGYNVLAIDGELFIITQFQNAEGIVNKHILVGKDVTNITSNNHLLPNLQSARQDKANQAVVTYITGLPNIKREWDSMTAWTTYLTTNR